MLPNPALTPNPQGAPCSPQGNEQVGVCKRWGGRALFLTSPIQRLGEGEGTFGVSVPQAQPEEAHLEPTTSDIPAPYSPSTTSESPATPWREGPVCVYIVCLGEGGHGRVHVLGEGASTDFPFSRGQQDSLILENPRSGGA